MAKVLDGNYDDKPVTYWKTGRRTKADELDEFYKMAVTFGGDGDVLL